MSSETSLQMSKGQWREHIWSSLVRAGAAAYPLPPHGHHPNFRGARAAALHLLEHPLLQNAKVVLIGMEAVLGPLRGLLLERDKTIYVPHAREQDRYWSLENVPKVAAKLARLHLYGTEITDVEHAEVCVLASVAVDKTGKRLSKGFGWGAAGAPQAMPTLSLAHPLMVLEKLEEFDSELSGFATPQGLIETI